MPLHFQAKCLPSNITEEVYDVSDEDEAAEMTEQLEKYEAKKAKLSRELSDCVPMFKSVSFKGFDYSRENCKW